MQFCRIASFCTLLFTSIPGSSQHALDFNFGSLIHSRIHSEGGREEVQTQTELHRQKRQAVITPAEYNVAIEISFANSSLQKAIRSFLHNLSFPLEVNAVGSASNISSIDITTVCNSAGNASTHCYCEPRYGWPVKTCRANPLCPGATKAPDKNCDCIAQLPSHGPYCQPEDIPGVGESFTILMTVRLNISFDSQLSNSSSALYKKYKHDLENALTEGYRTIPGFRDVNVTGFRPGSVVVQFEVTTSTDITTERLRSNVAENLSASYQLDGATVAIISKANTGRTNFSISPENIFKGDTVEMKCMLGSLSSNVTWYHRDRPISNSSKHSVITVITSGNTLSTLKITGIAQEDAGSYICTFTEIVNHMPIVYRAEGNLIVSKINVIPSKNTVIVCDGERKELSCCTDNDIQWFSTQWKPNGAINISGTANYSSNCTVYLLQANELQCPADQSGTTTTYTCELSTGYGARQSKDIMVTYLRVANVTLLSSTNNKISEGQDFSLRCTSDVSNYDKVTWQIQNGNSIKDIGSVWYAVTRTQTGAESVLTVNSINQDWTGNYTCTFFQTFLNSSAHVTVEVFPLPLKQNIVRDPIKAFVSCPGSQVLKCCVRGTENYTVTFNVSQRPSLFKAERTAGSHTCYTYSLAVTQDQCSPRDQVWHAFCEFTNQVHGRVQSSPMILNVTPVQKVVCNSSDIGVGKNGALITKPCFSEMSSLVRGNITYKCEQKNWLVAVNSCLSAPVNNLLSSAESLVSAPDSVQRLPVYLETLAVTARKEQQHLNKSAADLGAVVEILNLVSVIPVEAKQETMENFLSTVDTVIDSSREAWKELKNGSSQLLDSVEQFSQSLQPINNTIPPITYDSLQLKGVVIGESQALKYNKRFSFSVPSYLNGSVEIGKNETRNSTTTIISVAYSTLKHIIPRYDEMNESVVNSLVITTTMSSGSNQNPDFQIVMTFTKNDKSLKNPRCVFWNYSFAGDRAGWDAAGCETTDYGDRVTCSCNHLTSFAILMSPNDEKPEAALYALDYLSYVGVSVSILSLLACIGIEGMVWKSVTKTRISYMRHICILNVSLALLIADVWFLVVAALRDKDHQVDPKLCTAAAFFIHFFYLCVFFWMLTLALMIFYHLVFILQNASKTIMKAVGFCLGYGCPLAISAITLVSTYPTEYTRENSCLLKWENSKALLALVTPAMVIVFINVIVTLVVIAKIPRRSIGEKSINEDRSSLYRITKCVGVLTPLLGLTWGFGLVTVIPGSPRVFYVLFTLFNAFQGLFILLFGILWDRKVREALSNKFPRARWSSQLTKSTSQPMSAPMLSISSPFSRTLNNLFGKAGKYQVSSTDSASPSSSSESTSKAYSLLT